MDRTTMHIPGDAGSGTSGDRLAHLRGRTIVVKYGGAAMEGSGLRELFAADVARLAAAGVRVVIVHGGGAEITRTAAALGHQTAFIDGQRVTDREMAGIVLMVLAGRTNKEVVRLFAGAGARAVGLSGVDGGLILARKLRPNGLDLGFVGEAETVDTSLVTTLLDGGFLPVIAPTALGADNEVYNVNADVAASAVAVALGAAMLIYVSDVAGVMVDGAVALQLTPEGARELIGAGIISGGMIPKIESAIDALDHGVGAVSIVDGRDPGALARHLTAGLAGTRIVASDAASGIIEVSPATGEGGYSFSELNQEQNDA